MHELEPDERAEAAHAALEQAATEWFFRRDRGFTSGEEAAFAQWHEQDESHRSMFAEIEQSWAEFGQVRSVALVRMTKPPSRSSKLITWQTAFLAAAAAMLVGIFLWQRFPPPAARPTIELASTGPASTRSLSLPDGSTVQLNANSAIEIHFTANERGIQLVRGEAHFSVAKNPARPFIVNAASVAVRAVGTAFDVRMRPESLEVLVTEGTVRLLPNAAPLSLAITAPDRTPAGTGSVALATQPFLTVGERAIISFDTRSPEPTVSVATATAVEATLAWQKRRLEYADASLAEIVADFNRYNAHKLVIADPRLATRRFGAAFPINDYDSLVRLLESTYGVIAERRENDTILRLP